MTKLQETALEMDSIRGGLSMHRELIRDMFCEIADLSESVSNTKREDAKYNWDRLQRKIRLLHVLANHATQEFQKGYTELDENVSIIMQIAKNDESEEIKKPSSHGND